MSDRNPPNGTIWGNSPGHDNPKNPSGFSIRYTSTRGYELFGTGSPVRITPEEARRYQQAWNITPEVQARSMNEESGNRLRRTVPGAPPPVPTSGAASGTQPNGVTGSNAGPIRFEDAPSPSEERQEELINDVSQGPRFTRTGPRTAQSFNINSFRSEVLENDVLSTHSYLVSFSPFRAGFDENAPLTRFVTNKRNTLILRCENVVLPTSSLLEEENIRRYGYGPVEKVPYGIQFSDVTMTWLVDKNSELIEFFNQWMNTIVMHDSPNTLMRGGLKRPGLGLYSPFEIGYKDAYTNPTVKITVYNKQNETTTIYEMYDVFPMNIQAMNLSWADENELQKLTVTFAYTNMKVRAPRAKDDLPQENFVASGRIPPLMERLERIDNSGGRAAADTAAPPANESTRTTAGASTPNATTAPAPAPTAARPIPAGPATRTFVGPPAP
jgi:hypothetical protein